MPKICAKELASSRKLFKLLSTTVIACTAMGASFAAAAEWMTIANSSTKIPDGGSVYFSSFGQPSMNNNCTIVFRGRSTGPGEPVRGLYYANPCSWAGSLAGYLSKQVAVGDLVPQPNNLDATFNEFPAFPRIDILSEFLASRGQSNPVWRYILPDETETRAGTAGVYAGLKGSPLVTGASQLGVIPEFSYFEVPGYPGLKFDQFPGSPSPFDGNKVAFKGNFTDGTIGRTGVYVRDIYAAGGEDPVTKIADTNDKIPGTDIFFGSTAPPSAARSAVVFTGLDNEDTPTAGGIYRAVLPGGSLEPLVTIGATVPGAPKLTFASLGEALSFDGRSLGYWGGLSGPMRQVTLHCPTDGNTDVIAECERQCPDVDNIGHYCVKEVPVNQGIFQRKPNGTQRMIARAGAGREFQDFLFWVFSGRPPGVGGGDETDEAELPRWRASAFVAISPNGTGEVATAFKATKADDESGVYLRKSSRGITEPVILIGSSAGVIDPAAPANSIVTAVGLEREGLRRCRLAVNASFLEPVSSESWAGVYADKNVCD